MQHYRNFDVELFGHTLDATSESFSVRIAASDVGEQRIGQASRVMLPLTVRDDVAALRRRRLSAAQIVAFGEQLGRALLPEGVRRLYTAAFARLGDDEGLRVRLRCDTYGLAELPWEYAHVTAPDLVGERPGPEGFLALNRRISLVRYESQEGPQVGLDTTVSPIRMVALLAGPPDPQYAPLDLEAERRSIEQSVGDLPAVRVEFVPDATADGLLAALATSTHVFHFAGHGVFAGDLGARYGSQEGGAAVVLEAEQEGGGARLFPAAWLAMNLTGRGVRLAVLTACEAGQRDAVSAWAGVVTALTRAGIPAVVGMQFRIRDANAVAFSRAFYRALAAGEPIDSATVDGRLAVFNRRDDDERDWGVPVLYLRADEGVLFPAVGPRTRGQPGSVAVSPGKEGAVDKRVLREKIVAGFTAEDLDLLCSDIEAALAADSIQLQVNREMVGGGSKPVQVLRLIEYLEHRGYLPYLVAAVRQQRPGLL